MTSTSPHRILPRTVNRPSSLTTSSSRIATHLGAYLAKRGIASRLYYNPPLHLHPAFGSLGYQAGAFPVAEESASRMLAIPIFPQLNAAQIEWVADAIAEGLDTAREATERID